MFILIKKRLIIIITYVLKIKAKICGTYYKNIIMVQKNYICKFVTFLNFD